MKGITPMKIQHGTDEVSTTTPRYVPPDVNDTPDDDAPQAPSLPPVELTNGLDGGAVVDLEELTGAHVSDMRKALDDFDPAIHATNADGSPKRRGDGSYAKKRGRKPGQTSGHSAAPGNPQRPAAPDSDPVTLDIEQAARTATNLTIGVSVTLFGADFIPENKQEPAMMQTAFRDYFAERGVTKLPPEIALAAALAAYVIPRLSKPTVKTRAVTIGVKIRDFFGKFKRKAKGDATPDAVKESE